MYVSPEGSDFESGLGMNSPSNWDAFRALKIMWQWGRRQDRREGWLNVIVIASAALAQIRKIAVRWSDIFQNIRQRERGQFSQCLFTELRGNVSRPLYTPGVKSRMEKRIGGQLREESGVQTFA